MNVPPTVHLSIAPVPAREALFACAASLEHAFPLPENTAYLHALHSGSRSSPPERVVAERLGALALLPSLLGETGCDSVPLVLTRDPHGRPHVIDRRDGSSPVDFNLSHTGGYVACACVPVPHRIGIDIEEPLSLDRAEKLTMRYTTAGERAMMTGDLPFPGTRLFCECAAFRPDFVCLWTVREAIAKYLGTGQPLRYDASAPPPGVRLLIGHLPDAGTRLAVCCSGALTAPIRIAPGSLPLTVDLDIRLA